jgi:predicted GTPase
VGAAQRATQSTNTSLRDLLRKCEEVVAVLDEASRELDNLEAKLRRCSWKLTSLKDEAMKVEEVEGASLNKARLNKASDLLGNYTLRRKERHDKRHAQFFLSSIELMINDVCPSISEQVLRPQRTSREDN